ncbi:MAG: hypothetical protein NTU73_01865 [Ignavibacteriae bacterium]|nr:hypothetical protein [Ignavibacteriota bacterium]
MKTKIYQFNRITILLLLLTIMACGNKKTDTNTNIEKKDTPVSETNISSLPQSESPTADLEKAKNEGKTVFLLITGTGAVGVERAISIIKDANNKVSNSLIVQLNRDEAKNKELVAKFQVFAVPVPFILVISPKGLAVAGAPPTQVTADQLIKAIPSPKQDEVFFSISEKKPVLIVISKSGYSDKKGTISNCKTVSSKINTNYKEKPFLSQIGVTSINGKTITVVINSAGQITETFTEKPEVDKLTAAANKIIQNKGCSPGGCAPNGCK